MKMKIKFNLLTVMFAITLAAEVNNAKLYQEHINQEEEENILLPTKKDEN